MLLKKPLKLLQIIISCSFILVITKFSVAAKDRSIVTDPISDFIIVSNIKVDETKLLDTNRKEVIADTIGPNQDCTDYHLVAISDFPNIEVKGFKPAYIDTTREALAIDETIYIDAFAAATTIFTGRTGIYDLKLNTLAEIDGESSYRISINAVTLSEMFTNPRIFGTSQSHFLPTSNVWTNVALKEGDEIRVEFSSHRNGLVPLDSTVFSGSRGRWTSLELICQNNDSICQEGQVCQDGDPCTTGETYDAACNCVGGISTCAEEEQQEKVTDPCLVTTITAEGSFIGIEGLGQAPIAAVSIFDADGKPVYTCWYTQCHQELESIEVEEGSYRVIIHYFTGSYEAICKIKQDILVEGSSSDERPCEACKATEITMDSTTIMIKLGFR